MKANLVTVILVLLVMVVGMTGCGGGGDGTPATATGTEVWVGSNGQGNTNTTLTKNADGTITTTGQWTYNYNGATVTCQITGGNTTVTGSIVTFTGTGTATNPTVPAGYQTSPFTLSLTGTMSGGQGSGTFTITFQTTNWPPPISGDWTAQKQSGSGVTNPAGQQTQGVAGTYTGTFTSNAGAGIGGSYEATLLFVNDQSGTLTVKNVPNSYYNCPVTVTSVNVSQLNLTFADKDGDTILAEFVRQGSRIYGSWHYQNAAYTASGQIDVTRSP